MIQHQSAKINLTTWAQLANNSTSSGPSLTPPTSSIRLKFCTELDNHKKLCLPIY